MRKVFFFSNKTIFASIFLSVSMAACGVDEQTKRGSVAIEPQSDPMLAKDFQKVTASNRARISFIDAIKKALREDPEIGIAQAQLDGARADIDIERANTRPVVDLIATTGKENTYSDGPDTTGLNRRELTLSVEQTLYDFGATKAGIERRTAQATSAELRRRDAMESVALETIFSYIDYLRQSELVAAARSNARNHQRIAELVALNEQGGNATRADVSRANTRVEAAKSSLLGSQNSRDDASIRFRRLTGLNASQVIPPARLGISRSSVTSAHSGANLLGNPELQSLERDRVALEKQLKQQMASRKPRLFLRGEGNYNENVGGDTGTFSDVRGVVGVNVRLYSGGARRAQLRRTEARIREAQESYRAKLRELEQDNDELNQTLDSASENSAFVRERFKNASEGLGLFQQQFEAGERTAFELLDAQRDLFLAQTELINNRYQTISSTYEELRLKGNLVSSILANR